MARQPRRGIPRNGGEFETLTTMLDWLRRSLAEKLEGVSDEDPRRQLVSSRTTMTGSISVILTPSRVVALYRSSATRAA